MAKNSYGEYALRLSLFNRQKIQTRQLRNNGQLGNDAQPPIRPSQPINPNDSRK